MGFFKELFEINDCDLCKETISRPYLKFSKDKFIHLECYRKLLKDELKTVRNTKDFRGESIFSFIEKDTKNSRKK